MSDSIPFAQSQPVGAPAPESTEGPIEKPARKLRQKSADRSAGSAAQKLAEKSAERPTERRPARERLLAAADELFYEVGIHTIGIDRVIERAGVAKASLYDCFGSKEALIQAYLQARHEARQGRIERALAPLTDPRARLLAVFDALRELFAQPGFHGCAFARAQAEAQRGGVVEATCAQARGWLRELLTRLAGEAGATEPAALAAQLLLLYDGAALSAVRDGEAAATAARGAAGLLVDAALARRD